MCWFTEEQYDVWAGELSDSRTVLTVVSWSPVAKTITANLVDAGIQSAGKARDYGSWTIRLLWFLNRLR